MEPNSMNLDNLSVKTRLTVAFGAMVVIIATASALAVNALSSANSRFDHYVHGDAERIRLVNDVLDAANARAVAARNLMLVTQAADRDAEKSAVGTAHEKMNKSIAALKEAIAKDANATEQERRLFAEIERVESRYAPVALDIVGMATAGKRDEAVAKMNAECRPLLAALVKASDEYLASTQATAAEQTKQAADAYAGSRNLLLAVCALAVGLAAVFAWSTTRGLIAALGAEPSELGAAAKRVAAGNLSPVPGAERAPAGSVLASLGEMQASLAHVVSQVRQASDSIATGSAQIASGNADLSQRTETQASNLQQTAASMEEINSTVRNNADTANQANQLAASASTAAARGGEVVGQVVTTMEEISTSSRRIADIIGVIDGIAFQTNILALNAAVEAARAGEQGRGFAVVAGEVRSLAQRSAEAAREIKALIGNSVERVETGSRLVGDAGATMSDIVTQVKRVADLIGEISSATREQTAGIDQISSAVNQLDQVTQQNAALVEQSAAAADSLKQQAAGLTQLVSIFSTSHAATQAAIAQAREGSRPAPRPVMAKAAPSPARLPAPTTTRSRPAPTAPMQAAANKPAARARPQTPSPSASPSASPATPGDDWETF
jgi:methyl-accepting chemotaxis protein-1 (serine sensor receptor)